MIDDEQEAQIRRLYFEKSWRMGSIARELGIHHSTVGRVLSQSGVDLSNPQRPSMFDRFVPFILDELKRHPKLRSTRLYQMVTELGYVGGPDHFRHMVARIRPKPQAEAFLKLRTLPGVEAQVDWADFGTVSIGSAEWRLSAFLMVLSWSRTIYLKFYLSQKMAWFLRGHEEAFKYFGGIPRVILYDNLKSAVISRRGLEIVFNKTLFSFSGHHGYEPRPVAPYRGSEKGRVERAVRYVRDSFFAGLRWSSIDELNEKALIWMEDIAGARPWQRDKTRTVRAAFIEEKEVLRPLSSDEFPCDERVEAKVGKSPYIRYECNDYSVPMKYIRHILVVYAGEKLLRIFDGEDLVAEHERSFDKGVTIDNQEHIAAIRTRKTQARRGNIIDRLHRSIPQSEVLLKDLASRGENLGTMVSMLYRLLDSYGSEALRHAVSEAIAAGSIHPNSLRHILDRKREEQNLEPTIPIQLPDDPRINEITVRPHDLSDYNFDTEEEDDE